MGGKPKLLDYFSYKIFVFFFFHPELNFVYVAGESDRYVRGVVGRVAGPCMWHHALGSKVT